MENHRCLHCKGPLAPFNLLENDAYWQIVFTDAKLEPGLAQHGLRCTANRSHQFGFRYGMFVEIDTNYSERCISPPNPTYKERAGNWLAEFVFNWFNWAPLPKRVWKFLRDQILCPWQVAESWYVVYDPNADQLSSEEEARILEEAARDAELDREHEEAIRRQEEQEDRDREHEVADWIEHCADEEDRDHNTHFPDDDDSGDARSWDDDDSNKWEDDPITEEHDPVIKDEE